MINIHKANAVTRFFSILTAVTFLCFTAFFLFFSEPKETSLGIIAPRLDITRVYQTEPFSFSLEEYRIFLPRGSAVMAVPLNSTFTGLVFLGEGKAIQKGKNLPEKITGGYLVVDKKTYLQLKGDTLFLPLEDHILKNKLSLFLEQEIKKQSVNSFGFERIFLPPEGKSYLYLEDNGVPLEQTPSAVHGRHLLGLILYFSLVIAAVLLVAQLLTLDLRPSYSLAGFLKNPPDFSEKLLSAAILFTLFLFHGVWPATQTANPFCGEIAPAFLLLYLGLFLLIRVLASRGKISRQYGLFQWRQFPRDLGLALAITLIITVFSTVQIPSDLPGSTNTRQLFLQFLYFFSRAAVFELIWRNFLQTTMERLWGMRPGLLLATLIFTGVFFASACSAISEPNRNITFFCELLFFVPATALILGYIYQKTRSILGNALILALIMFLPKLLIF
ncbi:MAG: CPBP family intramembrane metalloprotease [Firmicutes bacterium]|nr:CPBP family intramembrane metalloprotease [Bacillota bacterium]